MRILFIFLFVFGVFLSSSSQESVDSVYNKGFLIKTMSNLKTEINVIKNEISFLKEELKDEPNNPLLLQLIEAKVEKLKVKRTSLKMFRRIKFGK